MIEKERFAKFMWALARAIPRYAPDLKDQALIETWYAQLGHYGPDALAIAFRGSIRRFDAFPSIRELLELLGGAEPDAELQAKEVADRILSALSSGGSAWSKERLEAYLGPIGSEVVRLNGGIRTISDTTDNDNVATMKAQWRGTATSVIAKVSAGIALDQAPQFDRLNPNTQAALTAASAGIVDLAPKKTL